jgi:hypothetical protein
MNWLAEKLLDNPGLACQILRCRYRNHSPFRIPKLVIRGTVDEDAGITVRACEVDGNNSTDSATPRLYLNGPRRILFPLYHGMTIEDRSPSFWITFPEEFISLERIRPQSAIDRAGQATEDSVCFNVFQRFNRARVTWRSVRVKATFENSKGIADEF